MIESSSSLVGMSDAALVDERVTLWGVASSPCVMLERSCPRTEVSLCARPLVCSRGITLPFLVGRLSGRVLSSPVGMRSMAPPSPSLARRVYCTAPTSDGRGVKSFSCEMVSGNVVSSSVGMLIDPLMPPPSGVIRVANVARVGVSRRASSSSDGMVDLASPPPWFRAAEVMRDRVIREVVSPFW